MNKLVAIAFSLSLLAGCAQEETPVCTNDVPGFLLSNIKVIDGTGAPAIAASVRVSDGKISELGDLEACAGETNIDGDGLTLAPGFIDTHSHGDGDIDDVPDALASVSQGITTMIVGQDGGSNYPLADFFAKMTAAPSTVNIASYIGHNTLREEVMGEDFKRVATNDEVVAMSALLASELESGALGLATGLEYEPGIYSETTEVIALAKIAADAGGTVYQPHTQRGSLVRRFHRRNYFDRS